MTRELQAALATMAADPDSLPKEPAGKDLRSSPDVGSAARVRARDHLTPVDEVELYGFMGDPRVRTELDRARMLAADIASLDLDIMDRLTIARLIIQGRK